MSKKKRLLKKQIRQGIVVQEKKEAQDNSPVVYQKDKISTPLNIIKRELTEKQKQFVELALDKSTKMILVSGPSGTTKTYLAVLSALMLMNQKKISDIVYVRSIVESADVKMGTLPGEKDDKISPYRQPLMDKLDELLPNSDVHYLTKEQRVEGLPVGYLRGLNWNAKAIIGDEMQNCTRKEIITLMTRTGEFSKVFLLGDPMQTDIRANSGFKEMFNLFNDDESKTHGIYTFEFGEDDILRSALVKFIVHKIKQLG
jgi:phosphate starvation-inducible PhoH-like protein